MILNGVFNAHSEPFVVGRALDKDGHDICIVDNLPSEPFNENDFGWIRNDFNALLANESQQVQEKIIARLRELPALTDNSQLSDEEVLSQVMPRGLTDIVDYERHVNSEVSSALRKYRESLSDPLPDDSQKDGNQTDS